MITPDGRKSQKSAGIAVILIREQSQFQDFQRPMVRAEAQTVIQAASLQAVRPAAAALPAALAAVPQAAAAQAATGSLQYCTVASTQSSVTVF